MGSGHLGTVLTREVLDDVARYGPEQVVNFAALTGKWAVVAAVANCALPKGHPLKIHWEDVHQLRSRAIAARDAASRLAAESPVQEVQEARADAAFFRTLATKLQALLPRLFERKGC
jgi:hypothetical protein